MIYDLEIEPGGCPDDLLAEVLSDGNLTEYGVPISDMQSGVAFNDLNWVCHEADLTRASRLARGAMFTLTIYSTNNEPFLVRKLFKNGKMKVQDPVITWQDS